MRLRLWAFTVLVVLANVAGNLVLALGMKQAPRAAGPIAAILQPVAIGGIVLLIAWMLLRMRLLGWADLSFVVPVSAFGYVMSALAGVVFLHEQVPVRGWMGIALIMAGATLTGSTENSEEPQ
jgi:uncharacterized membrane protein